MKPLIIIALFLLPSFSRAEPVLRSPNAKYEVALVQPKNSEGSTKIILRDLETKKQMWDFDYDSIAEKHVTDLIGGWSPDSRYIALTIQSARTAGIMVLRIEELKAIEVEILPIPEKLNKQSYTHRGGEFFSHWESGRALWVNNNTKNRSFRYSLTDAGKLLPDAFEDDPSPAEVEDGAAKPNTAPQLESDGNENPNPESKARTQ